MYRSILIILSIFLTIPTIVAAANKTTQQAPKVAAAEKVPPPNILSIIPSQGEPGDTVTLSGSGFTGNITVNLGTYQMPAKPLGQQLSFDIPELPPGLYALYIRRGDNATSRTYSFTVLPLKPVAESLSPDTITACSSGRDRVVTISGHNFIDKSQVIFDGAAIKGRFLGSDSLSFSVPQVAPGLHQVQIKNRDDSLSGVLGLMIDGRPEITSVTIKDEYVTSYNLLIEGRNFQQNSVLVVTEESTLEQGGAPQIEVRRIRSGGGGAAERDRIMFSGCTQLIYQRFPYSSTLKSFRVQVVNPNGEESSVVQVSAP
jgi:hypothetical protein